MWVIVVTLDFTAFKAFSHLLLEFYSVLWQHDTCKAIYRARLVSTLYVDVHTWYHRKLLHLPDPTCPHLYTVGVLFCDLANTLYTLFLSLFLFILTMSHQVAFYPNLIDVVPKRFLLASVSNPFPSSISWLLFYYRLDAYTAWLSKEARIDLTECDPIRYYFVLQWAVVD